ncbi:MAG: light-harvesting antenna LH1, alpha subunit [Oscillochloridaceae bacterium umkhey_bin13]
MPSRSSVRTNIVIFTILGFVVALLIHFIVLSSTRYNWLDNLDLAGNPVSLIFLYVSALLG